MSYGKRFNGEWNSPELRAVYEQRHQHANRPFWCDGVWYIRFSELMMYDWDLCEPGKKHATIDSRLEALQIIHQESQINNCSYRVYVTPAGVRAFDISRILADHRSPQMALATAYRWASTSKWMHCDPAYEAMVSASGLWACRLSPKVGRHDDYVAAYWGTVRGSDPISHDALAWCREHDRLITRGRMGYPEPDLNVCVDPVAAWCWDVEKLGLLPEHYPTELAELQASRYEYPEPDVIAYGPVPEPRLVAERLIDNEIPF